MGRSRPIAATSSSTARVDVVGRPDARIVVDSGKLELLRPWDLLG